MQLQVKLAMEIAGGVGVATKAPRGFTLKLVSQALLRRRLQAQRLGLLDPG
jgi:hypothetical protein